jgi:hypothetical protein
MIAYAKDTKSDEIYIVYVIDVESRELIDNQLM